MNPYRALPSVEVLAARLSGVAHADAVAAARQAVAEAREAIAAGAYPGDLDARARRIADARGVPAIRCGINATGVLLHTNLGRATLAPSAVAAVAAVAAGHATLEVDEDSGGRGERQRAIAALLRELTGAEDALAVNNNAGATYLAIGALAAGREVVLSRGEMVEIGGQFRLPDVIVAAGALLVEVGATNRTRIADYERALTERTGLLLRCHPSNYRLIGFTEAASLAELVALGRRAGVPVGDDLGSGALVDLAPLGLLGEPTVEASISAGADLTWFSGDKLLGGPQAGIVVGRADRVARLKAHPLYRALRPDKLTLAALEATLRLYRDGRAWDEIPILRRLRRPEPEIRARCRRLARSLAAQGFDATAVPTVSEVGGGSLPGQTLPSWAVSLAGPDVAALARSLRSAPTPVYGRIEKACLLLDLRAVDPDEEPAILAAFAKAPPPR